MKMSEFLQVTGNESKRGGQISVAHDTMRTAELLVSTFAGNRIKMTIIMTASIYSALITTKTTPTA